MPTNDKPRTMAAAALLVPKTFKGPIDWFIFTDLIASAVKTLITGCAPTPTQAVRYLTWRPWVDWGGRRLAAHREEIKARVRRAWRGPADQLADVTTRILDAIDDGSVTVDLMRDLYAENR